MINDRNNSKEPETIISMVTFKWISMVTFRWHDLPLAQSTTSFFPQNSHSRFYVQWLPLSWPGPSLARSFLYVICVTIPTHVLRCLGFYWEKKEKFLLLWLWAIKRTTKCVWMELNYKPFSPPLLHRHTSHGIYLHTFRKCRLRRATSITLEAGSEKKKTPSLDIVMRPSFVVVYHEV